MDKVHELPCNINEDWVWQSTSEAVIDVRCHYVEVQLLLKWKGLKEFENYICEIGYIVLNSGEVERSICGG